MNKHLPKILALLVVAFGGATIAYAQSYVPLAPLPGTVTEGAGGVATTNMGLYISGAIKLAIALGAGLAFLFAIIGGTQYVASSINVSAKADALERLQRSLIGLAIILSSYLILNSIDPKLVAFNLSLEEVSGEKLELSTVNDDPNNWGDDTSDRNALKNASSITVNKDNCTRIGQTNCTSVYGISLSALNGLKALAEGCKTGTGAGIGYCKIEITGGTEHWLHKSHNDGRKVDLSKKDNDLNEFIMEKGVVSSSEAPCGFKDDFRYQPLGPTKGTYVDEQNRTSAPNWAPHWHVCY